MKTIVQMIFVSLFMMVAAPSYSSVATQMWKCEMEDDATEEEVEKKAAEWLKAARQIEGGEKLEAHLFFPVVVNAEGTADVLFVVTVPSFEEWGKFWDRYPASDAAELESKEKIVCPDSVLWETVRVE